MTAACECLGVVMAARMWRATDGVSTSRPYTDDALRCVLCFLAIAGVDVLCGVATFPASVTGGGPLHAWVNGAVDGRYGVAAMAVGVNALLSAAATHVKDYLSSVGNNNTVVFVYVLLWLLWLCVWWQRRWWRWRCR